MDRVCDAALNAWCIVDGSTSEEKTLLSMLENVFRYYFEYNDRKKQTFLSRLSTGMADIPIDPSYSADWNNFLDGLKTFVLNIKTLEYEHFPNKIITRQKSYNLKKSNCAHMAVTREDPDYFLSQTLIHIFSYFSFLTFTGLQK